MSLRVWVIPVCLALVGYVSYRWGYAWSRGDVEQKSPLFTAGVAVIQLMATAFLWAVAWALQPYLDALSMGLRFGIIISAVLGYFAVVWVCLGMGHGKRYAEWKLKEQLAENRRRRQPQKRRKKR